MGTKEVVGTLLPIVAIGEHRREGKEEDYCHQQQVADARQQLAPGSQGNIKALGVGQAHIVAGDDDGNRS